ncbi:MAG: hypothetical protein WKI04_16480 [Ferruginibacter sp.]
MSYPFPTQIYFIMRNQLFIFIVVSLFAGSAYAQTGPATRITQRDSLEILNDLIQLLDSSGKPGSYVFVNIGIGNRLFSTRNNAFTAGQSNTTKVLFSPSAAYFNKSGLSLTAGVSLLTQASRLRVTQYSLSPSYDLTGNKNFAFGVSYTHYFVKDKSSAFSSPIQNDFYTSFTYKKPWLRPGIGAGYATGEFKELKFKDTVVAGVNRHFYDSVTYKVKALSIMVAAGHQFFWFGILQNNDGLAFTPTIMANAGSARTAISHKTNAATLFNFLNKRGRIPKLQRNKFEMQSVGLNLDLDYTIGGLTFQPQLYTDYYLQNTEASSRVTTLFTINIGYTF